MIVTYVNNYIAITLYSGSTRWNVKSTTVNAIYEKQEVLKECLQVLSTSETPSSSKINDASAVMEVPLNS